MRKIAIAKVVVVFFLSLSLISLTLVRTWNIQTIAPSLGDTFGRGGYGGSSLALDSQGNPHMSISKCPYESEISIMYASLTGLTWHIQTVEYPIWSEGDYSSMALDSTDNPHIIYVDISGLKYTSWNGTGWNIQPVDSTIDLGENPSLALDSEDNPHISYNKEYYDQNTNTAKCDLRYASWNGTGWNIQTVDSTGLNGCGYPSLAVDSSDNPHISYKYVYNDNNDNAYTQLKYASWTGSEWNIQTIDSIEWIDSSSSLALDSANNPHVSYSYEYLDQNAHIYKNNLRYASWNGSAWNTQTVDRGDSPSLALDSAGNPHISYNYLYTDNIGNRHSYLKYASWTGSNWNIQTIDQHGAFSSLVLDSFGNPYIGLSGAKFAYIGPPIVLGSVFIIVAGLTSFIVGISMRRHRVRSSLSIKQNEHRTV